MYVCTVAFPAQKYTGWLTPRKIRAWGDLDCSLLEFSQGLQANLFVRISRQAIVHIDYVGAITPGPGRDSTVTLKRPFLEKSFVITQERKKELLLALNRND